ncbi:DUF1592 domain-containing protein [Thalassoroseus pseudoceratinae]|uniref:DUF1592 domain-containing protein n=1 Tax=Thalassoroseus pseudoceratinae TaxID=2713176 RepID=UPI00141F2901|nr:DUF1592 domain-containing protein [Thalassoroseus pseudoceratinae]
MRLIPLLRWLFPLVLPLFISAQLQAEDTVDKSKQLETEFRQTVKPFLESFCLDCHGEVDPEAKLDLSGYDSLADVTKSHQTWKEILDRVTANEMPPEEFSPQPTNAQRESITKWVRSVREHESTRNAGDPGPVLVRRLNNAEYNYTIRDLTGVDVRPTQTFPVDPANEAGFDNSGESLTMSPALMGKYLEAARMVAEHMVLTPSDFRLASHPVVTETDRDKYCVNRIVDFYANQPTNLADYFFVCWQNSVDAQKTELIELAKQSELSVRYTQLVWKTLHAEPAFGPLRVLQERFHRIPADATPKVARRHCDRMRDYVQNIRPKLSKTFENLKIADVHKGSQSLVLWKNEQYAANRRRFDPEQLIPPDREKPKGTPPELVLPEDADKHQQFIASVEEFCSVFPDAFYISERGRDYLGVPKEKQEKGRLLSAGFHSMMGYFRDDAPLCELILDEHQHAELDRLWQELDFITFAPRRQYLGFLWFERTDSRFMRDPEFDFARAENKNAASTEMIESLSKLYLAKAGKPGGDPVALKAIADYFRNIDRQIQWVETTRETAEPAHRKTLLEFAADAWRRELTPAEKEQIVAFYETLRETDGLDHVNAMRDSVVSILMSPHFLYRTDLISIGEGHRELTNFELANRLSFFLWSSAPDEELRSSSRNLNDAPTLRWQFRRMLQDERIAGLSTEFMTNWLDIRRFEEHNSVDRNRFPQFTDELRQAMFEEPVYFFTDLLNNDGSILELLNARHTFVNPVLAKHYGMTKNMSASAPSWQRIDQADAYGRGGLLGMSVFLTKNSPGLRTSPVKRGYWVARRLLGENIPPPPPNVPDLPEDETKLGELSLRDVLARHRDHESCAGCHKRFDSLGLAFEGFGPIGEKREIDLGGRPVETSGEFPGGVNGTGLDGVRDYITQHRQAEFVDNFCRKLLAYALGRQLLLTDEPLLADMKQRLHANDYRISSIIEAIVTSQQFRTKRGRQYFLKDD